MMPAAKHFDPVLGIDIHIIQPPGPVPPVPIPHPFVGFLIDPFDYVPIVGATVMVNGLPRGQAGTSGKAVPPHIPIGGVFVKPPANECEMFMGSATVEVDGDAFSYLALPALSCQDIGMPPIPRMNPKKKSKVKSLVLPTSVVLPIPGGPPVLVGGPPTISLMALGMKLGMAALGKALKKLKKMKGFKRLMKKFKQARQKMFKKMKPGFLKCKVLKAEPVDLTTGEVVVDQEDFSIPGRIPLKWTRYYGSQNERQGVCGYGWETPADARLVVEPDGIVVFYDGTGVPTLFPGLPEDEAVMDEVDGATLFRRQGRYEVMLKNGLTYRFPQPLGIGKESLADSIHDSCGNWVRYERDADGLKAMTASSGRQIEVHSEYGRVRRMALRHPDGSEPLQLASFEYSSAGDLVAVFDALDQPYRFLYRNHCLIQHQNRNGLSFYYDYDQYTHSGRCVHTWGDGGLYDYQFTLNAAGVEVTIVDSLGCVTKVTLDDRGLPVSEVDALGGVTQFEYDEAGRTRAVVDPDGHRTDYEYDSRGNLVKLTRPDGKCIVTEFNDSNLVTKIIDPNNAVWRQEWDSRGLLIRQISPQGSASLYQYDVHGQLVCFINPNLARTMLRYDTAGNLSRLTDALGHSMDFAYDRLGNVTLKTDPLGHESCYEYDLNGRLVKAVLPSGAEIACDYDHQANLTRYVDENGAETRLEYCGLGEIRRRVQPDGHVVEYHYDTEERLVGVTNQRGEHYELRRDALGRVIEEVDYWGQARRYAYSSAGSLREGTDALGRVIRYQTDKLGRIIKRVAPDLANGRKSFEETFEYDANGNLTGCENPHIRVERRFDFEGRLVEERQGEYCIVANNYDPNGNRISRVTTRIFDGHPHFQIVRYGYDLLDRAIRIEADGHPPIELTRNALGQRVQERLSFGLRRQLDYSADGHLTHQLVVAAGRPVFDQSFRYDRAGNLDERQDSALGVDQYKYDRLGRVTAHLDPQHRLRHYLNDPAGDLLGTRVGGSVSGDWLREGEIEGIRYRFDRAGNLIERNGPHGDLHLVWDANQRLIQSRIRGRATTYCYDALGRRISKTTGPATSRFFWDGDALISEVRHGICPGGLAKSGCAREWVYYPGTFEPLVLLLRREPTVSGAADLFPELYVYHNDVNGCPTRLLDPIGNVVWAARYSVFGGVEDLLVEGVENVIRLQGQLEDEETGLRFNRYRYFDSKIGQFVSVDPLGIASGVSLYGYGANVLAWIDPLGLSFFRGATPGEAPSFSPRPSEFKIKDGLVQPTHGVSVFDNPDSVAKKGFDPHEIDMGTVPDTLQIKQRGQDPKHFEIMPKKAMPEEEYKTALDKIKTLKKGCG